MWKKRLNAVALAGLWTLIPFMAWAHGDDEVRLNSFLGPGLAVLTVLLAVPIGKALIRGLKKEKGA